MKSVLTDLEEDHLFIREKLDYDEVFNEGLPQTMREVLQYELDESETWGQINRACTLLDSSHKAALRRIVPKLPADFGPGSSVTQLLNGNLLWDMENTVKAAREESPLKRRKKSTEALASWRSLILSGATMYSPRHVARLPAEWDDALVLNMRRGVAHCTATTPVMRVVLLFADNTFDLCVPFSID